MLTFSKWSEQVLGQLDVVLARKVRAILRDVNSKSDGRWKLYAYEGYRDAAAQVAAYKRGNSLLMHGKHNDSPSSACGVVFVVNGSWSWDGSLPWHLVGRSARAHGLVWGGDWHRLVDRPHVELKG